MYKDISMLSRTHGQPATPTTMGKELSNFCFRIIRKIRHINNSDIYGKIGGATGSLQSLHMFNNKVDWIHLIKDFIEISLNR
jgi:adenylosuccinate lyase